MKKNFILFLAVCSIFISQKNYAAFFDTQTWTVDYGSQIFSAEWSPDGKFLTLGGNLPTNTYELQLYRFNGSAITELTNERIDYGGYPVYSTAWSPDGKHLAIGGHDPTNTYEVQLYRFDSLTLTELTSARVDYGNSVHSVVWSPDGNHLLIGGYDPTNTYEIQLYRFNGTTLTELTGARVDYGDRVYSVAWNPNGNSLAVGGVNPTNTYEVQLYRFDSLTLTELTDARIDYGDAVYSVAWSPDGNHLAIGGQNPTNTYEVQLYHFNGTTLTELTGAQLDSGGNAWSVTWSNNGKHLAAGCQNNGEEDLNIYEWNGTSLTLTYSQHHGTQVLDTSWSPDDSYLAVGGNNGGNDLIIYRRNGLIDGNNKNIHLSNHYTFSDDGMAVGNVRFKKGFSVDKSRTLFLDTRIPVRGDINLEYHATLELNGDLTFGTNLTSSHGIISGNGNTVFLEGDLTTIPHTTLHFSSDTVLDGKNHTLNLNRWSQLLVDDDVTLTLRNIKITNVINGPGVPILACTTTGTGGSKLALDNVIIDVADDFYFNKGQLYIHNDVVFTGSSQFVYRSPDQSFITKNATLSFEPNTTFFFDTANTLTGATYLPSGSLNPHPANNTLIQMQDPSSILYLNGCTLQATHTGMRLTKGQLFFENNVTLENNEMMSLSSLTLTASQHHGTSGRSVAWSPDGKYLAACGEYGSLDLIVYQWDGSTLTSIATKDHGTRAQSLAWSPDGKYLAVGGSNGSEDIIIYQFDNATLTKITSESFGDAYNIKWSPDGKYLAVAGSNFPTNFILYQFNGSTLSQVTSKNIGQAYYTSWHPSGKFIATMSNNDPNDLAIYRLNESTLTQVTTLNISGPNIAIVEWSPDGNYVAIRTTSTTLTIFAWDGLNLTPINSKTFASTLHRVTWTPDGKNLIVGANDPSPSTTAYSWNGYTLTQATPLYSELANYEISVSPNGNHVALISGASSDQLTILTINYTTQTQSPDNSKAIILGNSALGSDYNVDINFLNNVNITNQGNIIVDNAS